MIAVPCSVQQHVNVTMRHCFIGRVRPKPIGYVWGMPVFTKAKRRRGELRITLNPNAFRVVPPMYLPGQ